jgi:spore germination protein KA
VVSVAGVCGFVQPNRDLAEAVRIWRFLIAALGTLGGLFGVTLGGIGLLIHLSGLNSLDVAYLAPFSEGGTPEILRSRLKDKKLRDRRLRTEDGRNQR